MTERIHGHVSRLRLTDDSRPRYVKVTVHPSAVDLRRAARRTSRGPEWVDTVGCFHPTPFRAKYGGKGKRRIDTTTSYAGHVRLASGYLTNEIVIHEATHAALHLFRLDEWAHRDVGTTADLGEDCGPTEEAYAHLHGVLAASLLDMVAEMKRRNPWLV